MSVLDDATDAVRARGAQYGEPSVNFERIARLMNAWLAEKLETPLTTQDVAMLAICMKMGRRLHDPEHRDSVVDIAGYAHAFWEAGR
jgi:hypothetical protein